MRSLYAFRTVFFTYLPLSNCQKDSIVSSESPCWVVFKYQVSYTGPLQCRCMFLIHYFKGTYYRRGTATVTFPYAKVVQGAQFKVYSTSHKYSTVLTPTQQHKNLTLFSTLSHTTDFLRCWLGQELQLRMHFATTRMHTQSHLPNSLPIPLSFRVYLYMYIHVQ